MYLIIMETKFIDLKAATATKGQILMHVFDPGESLSVNFGRN
jgi:hypothetical protein